MKDSGGRKSEIALKLKLPNRIVLVEDAERLQSVPQAGMPPR